jgi:hypothetical protein
VLSRVTFVALICTLALGVCAAVLILGWGRANESTVVYGISIGIVYLTLILLLTASRSKLVGLAIVVGTTSAAIVLRAPILLMTAMFGGARAVPLPFLQVPIHLVMLIAAIILSKGVMQSHRLLYFCSVLASFLAAGVGLNIYFYSATH